MSDVCTSCPHAVLDHGAALGCMTCSCIDPGAPAETEPTPEPEAEAEPETEAEAEAEGAEPAESDD